MPEFSVSEHSPAAEEFVSLRENCGQSIARTLIIQLPMDQIYSTAPDGAMIGLIAAKGKEKLYSPFGFESRPNGKQDAGMTKPIV
ncbi:MAG: hypothetical protein ACPG97_04215 [Paracoccaceae bacterium]